MNTISYRFLSHGKAFIFRHSSSKLSSPNSLLTVRCATNVIKVPDKRKKEKAIQEATKDILPAVSFPKVKVDPQERSVVLFGGEGSEYVGMVEDTLDLPGVQEMYEQAQQILGYDVLDVTLNGPRKRLQSMEYNHVALFMANMAGKQLSIEICFIFGFKFFFLLCVF